MKLEKLQNKKVHAYNLFQLLGLKQAEETAVEHLQVLAGPGFGEKLLEILLKEMLEECLPIKDIVVDLTHQIQTDEDGAPVESSKNAQ